MMEDHIVGDIISKLNFLFFLLIYFNSDGETGDGTSTFSYSVPVATINSGALSGKSIVQLSTFGTHTCALANDGNSYCWGLNTLIYII
jgi:hypothetical protein